MDKTQTQEALQEIEVALQEALDKLAQGISGLPLGEAEYADLFEDALARASIAHSQLAIALRHFRMAMQVIAGSEEEAGIEENGEHSTLLADLWDAAQNWQHTECGKGERPYSMMKFVACYRRAADYFDRKAKEEKRMCAPNAGLWGALCGWLDKALGSKDGRHAFFYALTGKQSGSQFTACEKEALLTAAKMGKADENAPWLPCAEFEDEVKQFAEVIEQLMNETARISVKDKEAQDD